MNKRQLIIKAMTRLSERLFNEEDKVFDKVIEEEADTLLSKLEPVKKLDRVEVEKELYDMIDGINEATFGEQINECVHIASKNITALIPEQGEDDDLENTMWEMHCE